MNLEKENIPEKTPEVTETEPTSTVTLESLLEKQKNEYLTATDELALRKIRKAAMKSGRLTQRYKKMMNQWIEKRARAQNRLASRIEVAKGAIGAKNFNMLKDLYTIATEEQRDAEGNVVQKASKTVNYTGLFQEVQYAIVLEREQRIKKGLRKRSSGSSSTRRLHNGTLQFLSKRAALASIEDVQQVKE